MGVSDVEGNCVQEGENRRRDLSRRRRTYLRGGKRGLALRQGKRTWPWDRVGAAQRVEWGYEDGEVHGNGGLRGGVGTWGCGSGEMGG